MDGISVQKMKKNNSNALPCSLLPRQGGGKVINAGAYVPEWEIRGERGLWLPLCLYKPGSFRENFPIRRR